MEFCTRVLALLALCTTGCATGYLFEVGRLRESVLAYEEAFSDGRRLRLEYTREVTDRNGVRLRSERAAARFDLAELRAEPEHPIDAFPIERVSPNRHTASEERVLLGIRESEGRHVSFRLAGDAFEDSHPFRSGALTRYRTAWWVYALVPLAVTYDVISAPILTAPAFPYFIMGE